MAPDGPDGPRHLQMAPDVSGWLQIDQMVPDVSRQLHMTPDGSRASTGSLAVGRMFGKMCLERNSTKAVFYKPKSTFPIEKYVFPMVLYTFGLTRRFQRSPDGSRCLQMAHMVTDISR